MPFLHVEGEVLYNLELIDRVELRHNEKKAVLWVGGVIQTESAIAYTYFLQHDGELAVRHDPVECPKCQTGVNTHADLRGHVCRPKE